MRSMFLIPFLLLLAAVLPVVGPAWADDDAPAAPSAADRAKILQAEMARRSIDLVPYLQPTADPRLRRLAIRALGRIGDDGNGPGILRDLLASDAPEVRLLLWAAGIARSKELSQSLTDRLQHHIETKEYDLAAQAARSLGWTGAEGVANTLKPLLAHPSAALRAGALEGLGRARATARDVLLAASGLANDKDATVRAAADYACWVMAGRHRAEATKADESWDGDAEIAALFLGHLKAEDPERRMGGIRVLGSLLPAVCTADGPFGAIYALMDDEDPRVVQDAVWRIFTRRAGETSDKALAGAFGHMDPKVRHLIAQALGKHATPTAVAALVKQFGHEADARVREVLAVELVRNGKDEFAEKLMKSDHRAQDPVVRQLTEAELLLVSQRPEALDELMVWADPGASQRAGLHAATWMTVLGGFEGKEHAKLDEWLLGFLAGGYAVDKPDRHHVMASAVSLVGTNKRHKLTNTLIEMLGRTYAPLPHDEVRQNVLHVEVRKALMAALAQLAGDEDCPKETAASIKLAVQRHMVKDPSPWVRLAAREAATALKLPDVPTIDEVGQPNTWQGLPQDVRVADEDGDAVTVRRWLAAADVVRLADYIAGSALRVEFKTTAGTFSVALDAEGAPVHSVSLLLAVGNGMYTNSRFHRVVPNFVIQGGDPHGHGGGNGGWEIPDEITEARYVRGALGMPKSVKDDGGCQIFVMHSAYRPLDERYTCYGHVVDGLDAVDAIRVGDKILAARIVIEAAPR